jgi:dTDP-4-amino-4,6-dideoxygalactose transaminase
MPVAACNRTVALHLALFALELQLGDEVLIPAHGYPCDGTVGVYAGGIPVFCKIREDELTI